MEHLEILAFSVRDEKNGVYFALFLRFWPIYCYYISYSKEIVLKNDATYL